MDNESWDGVLDEDPAYGPKRVPKHEFEDDLEEDPGEALDGADQTDQSDDSDEPDGTSAATAPPPVVTSPSPKPWCTRTW